MNRKQITLTSILVGLSIFSIMHTSVQAVPGQWSSSGSTIYYTDGNVGIGTSTPTAKLHVGGSNTSSDSLPLSIGNTPERNWNFWVNKYGDPVSGDYGMVIAQPSYGSSCAGCIGDLRLQPGRNTIISTGNVGVGTFNPTQKLSVNGTILAKEVIVSTSSGWWPDYVFTDNYNLMDLNEVESFIKENKHLPGIDSASNLEESGVGVGAMQRKQMEKIEELTLYVIEQNKKINALENKLTALGGK